MGRAQPRERRVLLRARRPRLPLGPADSHPPMKQGTSITGYGAWRVFICVALISTMAAPRARAGAGAVNWSTNYTTVHEGVGTVIVSFSRSGGNDGAAGV